MTAVQQSSRRASPLGAGLISPSTPRWFRVWTLLARPAKERTYPLLLRSPRCRFALVALELGGRWSHAAATFARRLARSRARPNGQAKAVKTHRQVLGGAIFCHTRVDLCPGRQPHRTLRELGSFFSQQQVSPGGRTENEEEPNCVKSPKFGMYSSRRLWASRYELRLIPWAGTTRLSKPGRLQVHHAVRPRSQSVRVRMIMRACWVAWEEAPYLSRSILAQELRRGHQTAGPSVQPAAAAGLPFDGVVWLGNVSAARAWLAEGCSSRTGIILGRYNM